MNKTNKRLRKQRHFWLPCALFAGLSIHSVSQYTIAQGAVAQNSVTQDTENIQTEHVLPSQTIVIPPWGVNGDKQSEYFPKLLALALAKTEATDGPVDINVYHEALSGTRSVVELKHKNSIQVSWYGATAERMRELLPIKISLLRDLGEYRVLLIREQDQTKFSQVQTLEDLRKFTSGASAYWAVTSLLRDNHLPVKTVNDFSLLFPMLKAGRFDYISRNIIEVWAEAKALEKDGLVIEQELLLKGGAPLYFFVNKNNTVLADRIERGLNLALADGSFDELLCATPGFAEAAQEIKSNHRRVFDLNTK